MVLLILLGGVMGKVRKENRGGRRLKQRKTEEEGGREISWCFFGDLVCLELWMEENGVK